MICYFLFLVSDRWYCRGGILYFSPKRKTLNMHTVSAKSSFRNKLDYRLTNRHKTPVYGVFNSASLLCLTMPLNHGKITVTHTLKGLIILSYSSSFFFFLLFFSFHFCYALGSWPIFHQLVTITSWKNTALISGPKCNLVKCSSCWILVIHTCFLIIRGNSRQMWASLVVSSALMVKINKKNTFWQWSIILLYI